MSKELEPDYYVENLRYEDSCVTGVTVTRDNVDLIPVCFLKSAWYTAETQHISDDWLFKISHLA